MAILETLATITSFVRLADQTHSLIQSFFNTKQEKRSRALQIELERQKVDIDMQKLAISEKQLQLQEQMAINNQKLQLAIAEKDFLIRIELFHKQRELQRELAIFNAEAQYRTVKEHAIQQTESRFMVENYPINIRLSSYKNAGNDLTNKVKILISPPTVEVADGSNAYTGADVIMTSYLTGFLQESIPSSFYEFLGSAWRDDKHRAQSAYRNIYNELAEMPVLIVDSDIARNRLSYRICFWTSGSEDYTVRQIITNFQVDQLLKESVRRRMERWEETIGQPLLNSGKTKEDLKTIFPCEMKESELFTQEEELLAVTGNLKEAVFPANLFEFTPEDYDYCLQIISGFNAVSVGMFLDMHHMLNGNIERPAFLEKLGSMMDVFPSSDQCDLRTCVKEWVIEEYETFADLLRRKTEQNEISHLGLTTIFLNVQIDLVKVLRTLGEIEEADALLQETLNHWTQFSLGLSWKNLLCMTETKQGFDSIIHLMLEDRSFSKQVYDLRFLCKERKKEEYALFNRLISGYSTSINF